MGKFSQETIQKVWEKGKPIPGKNPNLYREDCKGNQLFGPSYGKQSAMGWEIDHKHPVSRGGTDCLRNLQLLQSAENKRKSNKYPY